MVSLAGAGCVRKPWTIKTVTIRSGCNSLPVSKPRENLESNTGCCLVLAELRRAFDESPDGNPNRRRDIAMWAGHFGDPQLALKAMRKVVNAQPAQMMYVWMPQLAPMRALPEFKEYMHEIHMVAYWEQYGWPRFCRPIVQHDFECH